MIMTKTISASVSSDMERRFCQLANESNVSKSEYLRRVLNAHFDRIDNGNADEPRRNINVFRELYEGRTLVSSDNKFYISLEEGEDGTYRLNLSVVNGEYVTDKVLDSGFLWCIVASYDWEVSE